MQRGPVLDALVGWVKSNFLIAYFAVVVVAALLFLVILESIG